LVTVTIIGIIAAMSLGGFQMARRYAAEIKTKATIAKLDAIVNKQYESYFTRRLPINIPPGTPPREAAWMKLDALRDMMRMEMPDCALDICDTNGNPVGAQPLYVWDPSTKSRILETSAQTIARIPSKYRYYANSKPWTGSDTTQNYNDPAQCLYLIVSTNPQDLEQFSQNEIGTVGPPGQEKRVFIDGWGKPIMFLRWGPGYLSYVPGSDPLASTGIDTMQTGDYKNDHDPFDSRHIDDSAYKLYPLIYSAGPDGVYGLWLGDKDIGFPYPALLASDHHFHPSLCIQKNGDILQGHKHGEPKSDNPSSINDNITNHQIETK
jgi:hypothetical protein